MALVDLDSEFLELFYNITDSVPPEKVELLDLKKQLYKVAENFNELKNSAKKNLITKGVVEDVEEDSGPAILVVDDLGVITYQLKVLLSQFEFAVDCSQEIYDAVNKFKKRKYQYVVMDLFIPTEREGFILLTELKKMAASMGVKTVIGVITASPRKEIEQQCKARGADFFLEKNADWQKQLCSIMGEYINVEEDEDDY